jgi:DNA primase
MTTAPVRVDVDALRERHPITAVVAAYGISLRPAGQSLIGRCPFHPDGGRPNFHVYPESQRWYCFRCAIGGDAIDFVRRQEGVGFADAWRHCGQAELRLVLREYRALVRVIQAKAARRAARETTRPWTARNGDSHAAPA